MARLQVLYLPSVSDGDRIETRWAMVADQAGELPEADREALRVFASEAGARGCLVLSGVLDVAQGDDEDEADEELVAALAAQLAAARQPQAPKLPPVSTTEGRLLRTLGGRDLLNQMEGTDPR